MPFTPYHFGPAGAVGLVFKRWIDIPAFILINVAIDTEVLYWCLTEPQSFHTHRFFHTYLGALAMGIIFTFFMLPFRSWLGRLMLLLKLDYKTTLSKALFSSILGGWFHVFIDSMTHWDIRPFKPFSDIQTAKLFYRYIRTQQVATICAAFWLLAIILYLIMIIRMRINKARCL